MPNYHINIIDLGCALGYFDPKQCQGVCLGVTIRWLEACLLDEEDKFFARVKEIENYASQPDILLKEIAQAKEKVSHHPNTPLTEAELEIFELMAFFEKIAVFHIPRKYKELLDKPYPQAAYDEISKIMSSDKIFALGGLQTISKEAGLYDQQEFTNYLNQLAAVVAKDDAPENKIGILFSTDDHAMGLFYDDNGTGHRWRFMDINLNDTNDNDNISFTVDDIGKVIKYVQKSYYDNKPYFRMETSLITTGHHPNIEAIKEQIKEFKNSFTITPEKITQSFDKLEKFIIEALDKGDISFLQQIPEDLIKEKMFQGAVLGKNTLIYLAEHHSEFFESPESPQFNPLEQALIRNVLQDIYPILKLKLAPEKLQQLMQLKNHNEQSLLHYAAQYGNAEDLTTLLVHGLEPYSFNTSGQTVAELALMNNNPEFLQEMANQNIDLSVKNEHGETLLHSAAHSPKHTDFIPFLLQHVDPSVLDKEGLTATHSAIKWRNKKFLAMIAMHDVDLNVKNAAGETPLQFAQRELKHSKLLPKIKEIFTTKNYVAVRKLLAYNSIFKTISHALPGEKNKAFNELIRENDPGSIARKQLKKIILHEITAYLKVPNKNQDEVRVISILKDFLEEKISWTQVEEVLEENPQWNSSILFSYTAYIKERIEQLENIPLHKSAPRDKL